MQLLALLGTVGLLLAWDSGTFPKFHMLNLTESQTRRPQCWCIYGNFRTPQTPLTNLEELLKQSELKASGAPETF